MTILSIVSALTLPYITYRIDKNFVQNIKRINFKNVHGNRLCQTYLVSYTFTYLSASLILISSIIYYTAYPEKRGSFTLFHDGNTIAISSIYCPSVRLAFAKLYNNKFARFKSDITIKKTPIDTSKPRSLYDFQNMVLIAALSVIIYG